MLLDTFNLTQHIQGPTHSHGHTPDLVITKGLNVSTNVMDLAVSEAWSLMFASPPIFRIGLGL